LQSAGDKNSDREPKSESHDAEKRHFVAESVEQWALQETPIHSV
jgi:hypothetical protein